jgi:anaerobic magnesium-protoporphyrin IX monomethyl ester cyclase
MYDVLLIAPPYKGMIREPIGLFYLAKTLTKNNISVKIIDLNLDRMNKMKFHEFVRQVQPKIIGITSYTFNLYLTLEILKEIKQTNPEITTVLGGVHASALPKETLNQCKFIDYIIIGEGELSFLELCQRILNKEPTEKIEGLAFREGVVKINPLSQPIRDLDFFQIPDRDPQTYSKYPIALVQTSRGCPYSCIFCNICNYYEHTIRYRSPKIVADECSYLVNKLRYNQIFFFGDSFTYNREWVELFCDELIHRRLKFEWACETRVNNVDLTILKKMKEAGCRNVQYGIDYGDETVLKKLGKHTSIETIIDAVTWAKLSDLFVESFFIFNCPGENEDTMNNTFDLIQRVPIDALELNLLTPYPGTILWSDPEKLGIRIIDKDFSQYTTKKFVLENKEFPRKKFVPAFRNLLKRLNLQTLDGVYPEIINFLEPEKKISTWI